MGVTVNACSGSGVYVVVGTGVVEDFGSGVFAGVWVGVNADSGLCVGVGSGDFERVGVGVIVGFGVGVLVVVGMMVRIGRRVGVPVGVRVINLCGSTTVAVFEIGLVCGDGVIVRVGVGELVGDVADFSVGDTGVGVDCVRAVTISLGSSPAVGVGCWLLQVARTRHKIAQCVIHSRATMRGRNELGVVGMRIGIQNRCNSLIGILVVRATTIHAAKLKRMGALGRSSQLRLWGLSLRTQGVLRSHPI